ncbi:MAG: biotin--[acetyl-CoA-carboxylase] ligase [Kiritimatiellae bacterium]|nr:biotin--[acetyl-CoA-carboxylase] ligase [Kiritimatiellia bacterium]
MKPARQIVNLLREAGGAEVSSRTICEHLGISRAAVWKHVESLRLEGYVIAACSRRGYRLDRSPDTPTAAEVVPLLTTARLGHDCRHVRETGSTNREMARIAAEGALEGVLLSADSQSQGRGRLERVWHSPPADNLYFSLLLRPSIEPGRAVSLPLVVGLAVAEAIVGMAPELETLVKWPNDILIGGRKVCGVLCEMQAEADSVRSVIPGVGLNVNMTTRDFTEALLETATSLRIAAGRVFSRVETLAAIINRMEPLYDLWRAEGLKPLLPRIADLDALCGKEITLMQGREHLRGISDGIQEDGALRLKTEHGIVAVYSGEAFLVRGT